MVNLAGLKRSIRRRIPDEWMARIRMREHSRHARVNVDVFLEDPAAARRWLHVSPDTYRIRLSTPPGPTPNSLVELGEADDQELRDKARTILADPEIDAVVVAETPDPGLRGSRRSEPTVGPRLLVMRSEVLAELGDLPNEDLPRVLARIRGAGLRTGLIPIAPGTAPTSPTGPILGDVVVLLGVVPLHDIGGGARSSQLALEYLRQGFHVVLVNLFEAQESVDLGLRFIHSNLEQVRLIDFDPELLVARSAHPGQVIVEAPHPALNKSAFQLQEAGWEVVYDLIDDWSDPSLGGTWFAADDEGVLASGADRLIASAPDLVERARSYGRETTLVPNAVNAAVFGVDLPPRPADLPEADTIFGYHGSLYGDWFDWDALRAIAEFFPEAAIVVIGDDKVRRIPLPPNVHFLGLKAQVDLPGYLQRFDVGLLPFKVTPTTHAVSPLKVYEYLASGINVAAPPLRSLRGLKGVFTENNQVEAVRAALSAPPPDRAEVLAAHSWEQRVGVISPERSPNTTGAGGARIVVRPVRHWSKHERLVD